MAYEIYYANDSHLLSLSNIMCALIKTRKVSDKYRISLDPPTLFEYKLLHPSDKKIWDSSYTEEYKGIVHINTWDLISKKEYKKLRKTLVPALPTLAIYLR